MNQTKQLRLEIEEAVETCARNMEVLEEKRNEALREIGNLLHDSCVISNDEVIKCCAGMMQNFRKKSCSVIMNVCCFLFLIIVS